MLPSDPNILLSYINTKLRDDYRSLFDLCEDLDVNQTELELKLKTIDYTYNIDTNKFV